MPTMDNLSRWGVGALAMLLVSACGGYPMFQTGKTTTPGKVSLDFGGAVMNNPKHDHPREEGVGVVGDVGMRVGAIPNLDFGFGTYMGAGLRGETKVNFLSPRSPAGLALRIGGGFGAPFSRDHEQIFMGMAGVVASYEVADILSVYGGGTFFNHWIYRDRPTWAELQPGEWYAPRSGYGDGILQLGLGLKLRTGSNSALFAEYDRWIPAQDDVGDFFQFDPANLVAFALQVCLSDGCDLAMPQR